MPEADLRETPIMKIALIAEHLGPVSRLGTNAYPDGQAAAGLLALAKALAAREHQVTVYSRQDSAALPGWVAVGHGVTVEYVPAGPYSRDCSPCSIAAATTVPPSPTSCWASPPSPKARRWCGRTTRSKGSLLVTAGEGPGGRTRPRGSDRRGHPGHPQDRGERRHIGLTLTLGQGSRISGMNPPTKHVTGAAVSVSGDCPFRRRRGRPGPG